MTERIEGIPFQEPSPQLFELLEFLEESRWQLAHVCQFEFSRTELYGLGELTTLQVDRLLTCGRLLNPGDVGSYTTGTLTKSTWTLRRGRLAP